uniref:Uncharacterized protein n=1 Tax=Aegilops tauschii TaxID=37682 RepID=M8C4E6_AEGTA
MLDGSGACRLKQQESVDLADSDGVVDGGWELGLVHGYDEIGHNGKICSIYCEHKAEKRDCFLVRAVGAVEVSSIDPHHDLPSQAFLLSAIHAAIGGAVGEATQVRCFSIIGGKPGMEAHRLLIMFLDWPLRRRPKQTSAVISCRSTGPNLLLVLLALHVVWTTHGIAYHHVEGPEESYLGYRPQPWTC